MHEVFRNTNQVLTEQRNLSNQILPAVNLLVQLLEESPTTRAALTGSLGNVRQITLQPPHQDHRTVAVNAQSKTPNPEPATSRPQSQTILGITRTQKINTCDVYCPCQCHVRIRLGTSRNMSRILGSGYIQTAKRSALGTECDFELCRSHVAPRISVQYLLPQWLASRMIFMWFTSSPPCGPELLLRFPRVLKYDNAAIRAVSRNDIEELKIAIRRGDCTPYDVDEYGDSLLAVSVSLQIPRFCILLMVSTPKGSRYRGIVGYVVLCFQS